MLSKPKLIIKREGQIIYSFQKLENLASQTDWETVLSLESTNEGKSFLFAESDRKKEQLNTKTKSDLENGQKKNHFTNYINYLSRITKDVSIKNGKKIWKKTLKTQASDGTLKTSNGTKNILRISKIFCVIDCYKTKINDKKAKHWNNHLSLIGVKHTDKVVNE